MAGVTWSFESGPTDQLFLGLQELAEVWLGDKWVWPPPMPKAQMDNTGQPVTPTPAFPLVRPSIIWDPSMGHAAGSWLIDYVVYLYDVTAGAVVVDPGAVDINGNPITLQTASSDPSNGIYDATRYTEWRGGPWPFPAGHVIELRTGFMGADTRPQSNDNVYARYTTVAQANPPFDLYAADTEAALHQQIGNGGLPHLDVLKEVPVYTIRMRRPIRWNTAGEDFGLWHDVDLELTTSPFGGPALGTLPSGVSNGKILNPPGGKWPLGYLYLNCTAYTEVSYAGAAPGTIAAIKVIA